MGDDALFVIYKQEEAPSIESQHILYLEANDSCLESLRQGSKSQDLLD